MCEHKNDYNGKICAICGSPLVIDENDIEETRRELEHALKEKNYAKIHSCHHLLADAGDKDSAREYAKLLEKGDSQLKNIDTAMDYYFKAAKKNDPFSAYRFSKLVGRSSEENAKFWLRFAAILGSINSYPDVSDLFSSEGKEEEAAYYCSLAAACDDTVSIVNMAKRWYDGVGVPSNPSFAKWYLDKLTIPPIHAIKLAYRLRSTQSAEPERLIFPGYTKYLKYLSEEAKRLGFYTAYFYLVSILSKEGDINAETALGILFTEGKGCERNTERGKAILELSMSHGNPAAAVYLGEGHLSGDYFAKNPEYAIKCFEKAAVLGYPDAYEKLGDIYRDGLYVDKNIPEAVEFYDLAAAGGCVSAKEKSDTLKEKRREFFLDAYKVINGGKPVTEDEAFSAFKACAIATAMGEVRAMTLLAKCYFYGFGTKRDRSTGFYWYNAAVKAGDREANLYLAFCYSRGLGVAFSFKNAVKYLKIAKSLGLSGAAAELDLLYRRRMKKMVRALYSQAMELLYMKKPLEAARLLSSFESLGYPKALYTLGCLFEFGKGVAKPDPKRAQSYYEKAYIGNSTFGNFKDPESDYKFKIMKLIR